MHLKTQITLKTLHTLMKRKRKETLWANANDNAKYI